MRYLQSDSTLQSGKYKVISTLGQGGFGITYLAEQTMLDRKVAIKEFFMKELCERDENTNHVTFGTTGTKDMIQRFREKFLKEAKNIAKLNHPNIVRIIDIFEENGTAYYVMEYADGGSLALKVKEHGCVSETEATQYIIQVANALDYIHQRKMNHLDIKPANIMLNTNGQALLIDFGLSKQYDAVTGNQTSTTPVGISEGYAPMEQYKQGGVGEFSPETDIYALGATFFKLLTGNTPPSASDVYEDGVPINELKEKEVSKRTIDAITKAMEARKRDRWKNVKDFIDCLNNISSSDNPSSLNTNDNDEETHIIGSTHPDDNQDRIHATAMKQYLAEQKVAAEKKAIEEELKRIKEAEERKRRKQEEEQQRKFLEEQRKKEEGERLRKEEKQRQRVNPTFSVNGVSFKMRLIENGKFNMGEQHSFFDKFNADNNLHQVNFTNNYFIGETPVTQELWEAVMGNNPSIFKGPKLPVENVSWDDCQSFIEELNCQSGMHFRLPTEAEWEYAARGGRKSNNYIYSGGNNLDDYAWYSDNSSAKTHDVATKRPNECGLFDMNGNVFEWCNDWYGVYDALEVTNPKGPLVGHHGHGRVYRGGCYLTNSNLCRIFSRFDASPTYKSPKIGLRLVLS